MSLTGPSLTLGEKAGPLILSLTFQLRTGKQKRVLFLFTGNTD